MNGHELELMARGGTLALLGLWSLLLWRDHRAQLAARCAIAMNVAIACYVTVTAGWSEGRGPEGLILSLGAGATPGLFWLFAKTWFEDRATIARRDATLVALAALNTLVMHLSYGAETALNSATGALFRLAMLGFAAAGLWHAWRGREGDLVEARRKVRFWLVVTVGLYVVAITFAEPAVYAGGAPHWIVSLIGASTAFITLWLCTAMFAVRQADLFGGAARAAALPQVPTDDPLAERLRQLIAHDKPHRDERLTIAALAARLDEQEYRLRRTINRHLGYRNFAQFLNAQRLAEVKQALADPAQREVPILTIALDAGFGSLGPFNRAFREAEAMTPSQYRAAALNGGLVRDDV